MTENYSNTEKLSEDLKNLLTSRNEENFSDFEVICVLNETQKTTIKCHKSILSVRSDYFKSLFRSKMKEYQENRIILEDVSPTIFEIVLEYFYTGKIKITLENAIDILLFSSKYLIEDLVQLSSQFVSKNLQVEYVVDILKLSESRGWNDLIVACQNFILSNFQELFALPSFQDLTKDQLSFLLESDLVQANEFDIFQALINWGKNNLNMKPNDSNIANSENQILKEGLSDLLEKIRIIDLSDQEMKLIEKTKMIPKEIFKNVKKFKSISPIHLEKSKKFTQKFSQDKRYSWVFESRFIFKSKIVKEKEYFQKLKEWIPDQTFLKNMKLGFSTSRDGLDCKNGTKFGWETEKSRSLKDQRTRYIGDPNAFVFTLKNYQNDPPQKFPIRKNKVHEAIYYSYSSWGPYVLDICLYSNMSAGNSNLFGQSYCLPDGLSYSSKESRNYFAGSNGEWKVAEMETYFL
ncbi:pep-cterm sorting domain-containing protein [Anaeramoeba ignava]|uniref:Pep-cterm sorting domain-containing protein n=1 Tax=Anaeramoeba ignava TaxID=1746090 RepID=A0A9Q0L8V8_ANAIG|nr:pep-cterm sorting domain-containing protein [Anaeramoeba ignava]